MLDFVVSAALALHGYRASKDVRSAPLWNRTLDDVHVLAQAIRPDTAVLRLHDDGPFGATCRPCDSSRGCRPCDSIFRATPTDWAALAWRSELPTSDEFLADHPMPASASELLDPAGVCRPEIFENAVRPTRV